MNLNLPSLPFAFSLPKPQIPHLPVFSPGHLVSAVRCRAGRMAYSSPLYQWSLSGGETPSLILTPPDPWTGDAARGRSLCQGVLDLHGERMELNGHYWEPFNAEPAWIDYLHSFVWLRDLKSCGGDAARRQARTMVEDWIRHYGRGWNETAWRLDLLGQRLTLWASLFEFFGDSADEEFQADLTDSMTRQARHLCRALPGTITGLPLLQAIQGLLTSGLAFEGCESWITAAVGYFNDHIDEIVLTDGGTPSRAPDDVLEIVKRLSTMRCALAHARYPVPVKLTHALDRAGPALRFFRHGDRTLALFNGAQKGVETDIEKVISLGNVKGRVGRTMPETGYDRLSVGRMLAIIDTGVAAYPNDLRAHAAPLAFELSYGPDRIFVSCGTHPVNEDWRHMLRATAAHTTLSIEHRNICEIRESGHFGRKPSRVKLEREDSAEACLLTASHDGYLALHGVEHRRRLYMSNHGEDFRGEDSLVSPTGLNRPLEVALRFHLHPRAVVSLIREGEEALIRLPGGTGWHFTARGAELSLEDSIYLSHGNRPRKTKQIVLNTKMETAPMTLKWALQKA